MKLHNYAADPLVKRLTELSDAATPGEWSSELSHVVKGTPSIGMYWVKPPTNDYQGVSMGSANEHDAAFVAALVNAWREGRLYVQLSA